MRIWRRFVADATHRLWVDDPGCGYPECCPQPYDERAWLESAAHCLPAADRKRFRALFEVIDERW